MEIDTIFIFKIVIALFIVQLICAIVYFVVKFFNSKFDSISNIDTNLYDSEMNKADAIITAWIKDEILNNAMIIELASFRGTFLGKLTNINFKSLLLDTIDEKDKTIHNVEYQTVEQQLDSLLKDTDEIRSYSHFLDLVRKLYIDVDTVILEIRKQRYFMGYGELLGTTPYTHDKKQINVIMQKYPWLWILEYLSNHPLVTAQLMQNQYVVETDKSKEMRTAL